MKDQRIYQRYAVNVEKNESFPAEVRIDGLIVHLVDFSLGGLCILSEEYYSPGDIVSVSVNLESRGQLDFIGKVIRVSQEKDSWSVAVDLSHSYKLNSLHIL